VKGDPVGEVQIARRSFEREYLEAKKRTHILRCQNLLLWRCITVAK